MTEKLYLDQMYMREFEAKALSATGNDLILDRTAFFPAGGGQPSDTGTISADGREYRVLDVKKNGDDVVHIVDGPFDAALGTQVSCIINWERRYPVMRFHTAMHLMDGVVRRHFGSSGLITGGQIYTNHARIDFDMEGMTREKAMEIVDKTNEVAAEGHEIEVRNITQEEASGNEELARTEPGRELIKRLPIVRIVEIAGVDVQVDGGTHVKNTKEIGKLILSEYKNNGKRHKRITITFA